MSKRTLSKNGIPFDGAAARDMGCTLGDNPWGPMVHRQRVQWAMAWTARDEELAAPTEEELEKATEDSRLGRSPDTQRPCRWSSERRSNRYASRLGSCNRAHRAQAGGSS